MIELYSIIITIKVERSILYWNYVRRCLMPARHKRPLARGFVNNKILESLLDGDKYGYEIIKEVKEKSGGKIELKQPSLYSSLKRFEQKGLISSYWGDSDIGGRRHYYSITEVGKNYYYTANDRDDFDTVLEKENEDVDIEEDQLRIPSPTLEHSDVYDEVHGSFEIDQPNDHDDDIHTDQVQEQDLTKQNQFLTDDILEKMKQQYQVENHVATMEEKEKPMFSFQNTEENDQHLQQDLFSTTMSDAITNDEVVPNFEKIQELKDMTPSKEPAKEKPKKEIPLYQEKPMQYHDWEDMKKQATMKKSFDMNDESIVSDSTKEMFNQKIFLDQDERIDVGDNVNMSLNHKKLDEKRYYFTKDDSSITPKPSYEEEKKNKQEDIDYRSILGELVNSTDPKQKEHAYMVQEELLGKMKQMNQKYIKNFEEEKDTTTQIADADEYKVSNVQISQNEHTSILPSIKDMDIQYYEPVLKDAKDRNFVKINKVNMITSFILAPIILLQMLIILLVQYYCPTLLIDGQLPMIAGALYIIVASAAVLIPIFFTIVYFMNPNKKKKRLYLTKNFIWNGMIAFFAVLLLILTLNMLFGCRVYNWKNYFAQLFIPAILATNFIIYPIVKGWMIQKIK